MKISSRYDRGISLFSVSVENQVMLNVKKKQMRKIVSVVVLALATMSLQAQLFIRPEAGMIASKSSGFNNSGWKAGAGVEYRFKHDGIFSLQSGAYYQEEFGKYEPSISLYTEESKLYIYGGSYRRQALVVPLLAKFSWKLSDQIRMHVAAGPNFNIRFDGQSKTYTDEIDYKMADGVAVTYDSSGAYAFYITPKQNEQGITYTEFERAMINQKRTTRKGSYYYDSGVDLSLAFNIGVEFNRLSVNLNYECKPGRIREYYNSDGSRSSGYGYGYGYYGYGSANSYYTEDKWGIAWHQISLTVGYSFQLTK